MGASFTITSLSVACGGRLGICPMPGACGRLEPDLADIVSWGPDLVVSLAEASELEADGAGWLAEGLSRRAIGWAHMPIRDFAAPGPQFEAAWPALAGRVHALLDAAGAVLLHCRGGCGRSGMVALRLMLERGEEPAAALERLRAAHPGAIETGDQLDWARRPSARRRPVVQP